MYHSVCTFDSMHAQRNNNYRNYTFDLLSKIQTNASDCTAGVSAEHM